jgi:hypothetical protein
MKLVLLFLLLLNAFLLNAEEGFDDGFDDNIDDIITTTLPPEKNIVYGSVNLETHYNFNNDKNLSSTKLLLDLTTDYKMDNGFKVNSNLKAYHDFIFYASNNYETTPSGYVSELNLNELNIEGSISTNLDFKIGRQIVVWGKSEAIRINSSLVEDRFLSLLKL